MADEGRSLRGSGNRDHLRAALQLLSGDVPRRPVYLHTGWRQIEGDWYYLHAGGAIGPDGPAAGVEVALPDPLAGFRLPDPPDGPALAEAIRASLRMLDGLAPDRIAFAAWSTVYRAVLGPADFSNTCPAPRAITRPSWLPWCSSTSGPKYTPGSWSSTGNALEGVAFAAKDALLVVDDFAPTGSTADVQRFHREADRLLRAQGNRAGRQRMRADGTLRPAKPPRGLILSTGEDVPRGQSLRSRMLVAEISPGDVRVDRLTECQKDAAAGLYAQALAGFLRWLARRYEELRGRLRQEAADLRDRARTEGQHARTPAIVADLTLGVKYFLAFAVEAGAVSAAQRDDLARRCWAALGEAAAAQAGHVQAAEPCGHFMRLLAGVLASGRGHVAGPDGCAPDAAERWGWRLTTAGENGRDEWRPQGHRVGWVDGEDVFLEPGAAYAEAQEFARAQSDSLAVSERTLWKRLDERSLLASRDNARQRLTVRRRLGGHDRCEVLHFRVDALSTCARPSPQSPAPPDAHDPPENAGAAGDGRGDGCAGDGPDRPHDRPQEWPNNSGRNGARDGGDGQKQVETPHAPEVSAPPRKPRRGAL